MALVAHLSSLKLQVNGYCYGLVIRGEMLQVNRYCCVVVICGETKIKVKTCWSLSDCQWLLFKIWTSISGWWWETCWRYYLFMNSFVWKFLYNWTEDTQALSLYTKSVLWEESYTSLLVPFQPAFPFHMFSCHPTYWCLMDERSQSGYLKLKLVRLEWQLQAAQHWKEVSALYQLFAGNGMCGQTWGVFTCILNQNFMMLDDLPGRICVSLFLDQCRFLSPLTASFMCSEQLWQSLSYTVAVWVTYSQIGLVCLHYGKAAEYIIM